MSPGLHPVNASSMFTPPTRLPRPKRMKSAPNSTPNGQVWSAVGPQMSLTTLAEEPVKPARKNCSPLSRSRTSLSFFAHWAETSHRKLRVRTGATSSVTSHPLFRYSAPFTGWLRNPMLGAVGRKRIASSVFWW